MIVFSRHEFFVLRHKASALAPRRGSGLCESVKHNHTAHTVGGDA